MLQPVRLLVLAGLLLAVVSAPANAAEREQVRIVINLMAAVKMPFPEKPASQPSQDPACLAGIQRDGDGCMPAA
jgi:hypothetical protein